MVRSMAEEMADRGITVNAVTSGAVDPPFLHGEETPESVRAIIGFAPHGPVRSGGTGSEVGDGRKVVVTGILETAAPEEHTVERGICEGIGGKIVRIELRLAREPRGVVGLGAPEITHQFSAE